MRRQAPSVRKGALSRLLLEASSKRHEVDFVAGDALLGTVHSLVRVCVALDPEKTWQREVSTLEIAMGRYGVSESTIVTMDSREEIATAVGTVHVVLAWKWLLDG